MVWVSVFVGVGSFKGGRVMDHSQQLQCTRVASTAVANVRREHVHGACSPKEGTDAGGGLAKPGGLARSLSRRMESTAYFWMEDGGYPKAALRMPLLHLRSVYV